MPLSVTVSTTDFDSVSLGSNPKVASNKDNMTNDEMMQQQINQVADIMKSMFTKEELEDIERKFNIRINEQKEDGAGEDN